MVKVNENWETRAFEAAERRKKTKQRKMEKSRQRSNKLQAQSVLTFLDQMLCTASQLETHIWTDSMPSNYVTDNLDENYVATPKKVRSRSNSFVTPPSTPMQAIGGKQRRSRSNSYVTPPSNTKSNRKNDRNSTGSESSSGRKQYGRLPSFSNRSDRDEETRMVCTGHFFTGKCSGVSKKKVYGQTGCLHGIHVSSLHQALVDCKTIGSYYAEQKLNTAREALMASKDAADAYFTDETFSIPGQMNPLFRLSLVVGGNSESSAQRFSEAVSGTLSSHDCTLASMVYVVVDGVLVFDRYRNGIVVSSEDEQLLIGDCIGVGSKRRSVSIGEFSEVENVRAETVDENVFLHHQHLVRNLPSQVLEYIALFLPDDAIARLQLVCQSWNNEIGRSSPDLWKKLLQRRSWPEMLHEHSFTEPQSNERERYRGMFISHYAAVRDLIAIIHGLEALEYGSRHNTSRLCSNRDLALLHFKDTQHNRYVSGKTILRIFSEACVLVGNSNECTLNLFDAVETSCGSYRRCRRKLTVSVAPFYTSNKKRCRLIAMDLDCRTIGCLFSVGSDKDPQTWLGLIDREDLLCAGSGGSAVSQLDEGALRSFDLQSIVLECLVSCDDDEVTGWIYSHFMTGSEVDLSLVEADIKGSIVACGNGQFLFEAAINLPFAFDEDNDELDLMSSSLLKVFLFDSDREGITWVGPAGISGATLNQFWYPLKTSIVGKKSLDRSLQYKELAFVSRVSADVATIRVSNEGDVDCVKVGQNVASESIPQEYGTWRRNPEYDRVVVATSSDIIVAESYRQAGRDSSVASHRTVFSFYTTDLQKPSTEQLIIDGNCCCFPIEPFRDDHLVAFSQSESSEVGMAEVTVVSILIHVRSRQVIHKIALGEFCSENSPSFSIDAHSHSIAVSSSAGLLLVGQDIKAFTSNAAEKTARDLKSRPEKKKKKGQRKRRSGKKDVFARGMRQSLG